MSNDQPSISIGTVTGGQNNIGKTEIARDQTQTNNFGESLPEIESVVERIAESIPEEKAKFVIPEIQSLAAMPIAEQELPANFERIKAVCDSLKPYVSVVAKNLAIFGATALETLAARNPVIAGVVQVCKANSTAAK